MVSTLSTLMLNVQSKPAMTTWSTISINRNKAMMTRVKTASEIAAIRDSGRMLATVLQLLKTKLEVGQSTKELSDLAAAEIKKLGGQPAFLGYQGFPDIICISVNDEVVHGIPRSSKVIQSGDVVSMDFGVTYDGIITDGAVTVIVDRALKPQHEKLVDLTKKSLE